MNSKQEFFTLDTRITLQRGNLYHKKVKQDDNGFYRLSAFLLLVLLLVYIFYDVLENHEYHKLLRILVWLVLFMPLFKSIYKTLFIKTWKSIIPIKDVKNITTKPLDNGLETEVTLHLSSGRKKFYTFRNAEGQIEPFTAAVSEHVSLSSPLAVP